MGSVTSRFFSRRRGNHEGRSPGTTEEARIQGLPMRESKIFLHLAQSELELELLALQRMLSQFHQETDKQIIIPAIETVMNVKQMEKIKVKTKENNPEPAPEVQNHQTEAGTEVLAENPKQPLLTSSDLASMAATSQSELEEMHLQMQKVLSHLKGEEVSNPRLRNTDFIPCTQSQLQVVLSAVEKVLRDKQIELETKAKANETHPLLLNEEAMQKIFNLVPLKTLRYLRQVSKTWWSASLPRCRQNYRMNLLGHPDLPDERDYPFLTSWITTSPNDPFQLETHPIQKFLIDFRDQPLASFSSQVNQTQRLPFWNTFGGFVKDLKIRDLNNSRVSASVSTWVTFLGHFPNVEQLHLENIEHGSQSNEEHTFDTPYQQLHRIFEAIHILKEKWGDQRPAIKGLNIMNARRNAIFYFVNATIRHFDILRFPLTSLELDIGIYMIKRGLRLLLEYHAATLQKLVLYRASFQPPYPYFRLGVMMNSLTELALFGPICENLLFLKYTPNLKVLKLVDDSGSYDGSKTFPPLSEEPEDIITRDEYREEEFQTEEIRIRDPYPVVGKTDFNLMKNVVVNSLQVFIGGHEECTPEQIESLAKVMPGLRQLRITIRDAEGIRAIFKNWKDMVRLEVTMLGNVWADDFEEAGLGVEAAGDEEEDEGICMLNLRYISVESVFVSDALVVRHLIRLPSWIHLSINACKMSDHAYFELIEKFPKTAIHRYANNC